jgi:hypothetical protein
MNSGYMRHRILRCIVAACVLIPICATASAVTLEEVAAAYGKQLEQLQPYRLRYKTIETIRQDDGTDKVVTRVVEILVEKLRYRKSVWTETAPEGQLIPDLIETDNGAERRLIWYPTSGGRGLGQIMSPQSASEIHSEMHYSSLALAGLLDSSIFNVKENGSLSVEPTDVRALVLHQEAVLLADPGTLDGKQAYVIEYPKSAPHPGRRLWLSADERLSLLKCEAYLPNAARENVPLTRTINRDFSEVRPGLFLPKRSEFQVLGIEGQLPPSTKQFEFVSIDIAVPVTDGDFLLEFPDNIHVLRNFSWGERRWSIENATFQKVQIIIGICLLIMVATIGFVIFRSLRRVR